MHNPSKFQGTDWIAVLNQLDELLKENLKIK